MTPQQFTTTYLPTAQRVSVGTGILPFVLLAQWACETAWGTVVIGNNLGNIRCSPTSFCRYATLGDFATACIATWRNGYYGRVLAATTTEDQLAAICASPWSAGHYGGSLQAFYSPLEAYELNSDEHQWLLDNHWKVDAVWQLIPTIKTMQTELVEIKTAIAAIPGGSSSVDLTAITAKVDALKTELDSVKAKIDKDLA